MKNFKKISIVFIIIIVILLIVVIWASIASETTTDIRNKALAEIKYFESKIIYMFNALNNIEFENYQISVEDINEKSKKSSQSKNDSSGGESSEESSGDSSSSEEGSGESENNSQNVEEQKENKEYSLNAKGVLTNNEQINWDYIKKEAEILENSISSLMLDLYEISQNNNEIINFNNDYDSLLIQLKNEDKQKTLEALNKVYSYIPIFVGYCNEGEQNNIIISTKQSIYNAYTILDNEDWELISKYVQEASDKFAKLLTNINVENKNQYSINKCYILLNGLKNATKEQDKEIFLIKYKNLLEDLNSL